MERNLDYHHIDLDHWNDDPDNFIEVSRSQHFYLHGAIRGYFNWIFRLQPHNNFKTKYYMKTIIKFWIMQNLVTINRDKKMYCVPVIDGKIQKEILIQSADPNQYISFIRPNLPLPAILKGYNDSPISEFYALLEQIHGAKKLCQKEGSEIND